MKSHGEASEGNVIESLSSNPNTSTSRALMACESCVKRKVRCDNNYPCSRCAARALVCNPRAFQRKRINASSKDSTATTSRSNNRTDEPHHTSVYSVLVGTPPSSSISSGQRDYNDTNIPVSGMDGYFPQNTRNVQALSMDISEASDRVEIEEVPYSTLCFSQSEPELAAPGYLNSQDLDSYFLMDWSQYPAHLAPMLSEDANGRISASTSHGLTQNNTLSPQPHHDNGMAFNNSAYYDHQEVIVGRDYWNVFKCTPSRPAGACPKSAPVLLQNLGAPSDENDILPTWDGQNIGASPSSTTTTDLPNILECTRDKLLAVGQGFVLKAHEIHSLGEITQDAQLAATRPDRSVGLLNLPSKFCLELFLKSFLRNFNSFYSTFPAGKMDVNDLMMLNNNKTSALLVLLAIAQGAMTEHSCEGLRLSGGLTEVCRISLYDMIERDILLARDQFVLQCALIFCIQALWSGDKWLMDIGAGQKGIYIAVGPCPHPLSSSLLDHCDVDYDHFTVYLLFARLIDVN